MLNFIKSIKCKLIAIYYIVTNKTVIWNAKANDMGEIHCHNKVFLCNSDHLTVNVYVEHSIENEKILHTFFSKE